MKFYGIVGFYCLILGIGGSLLSYPDYDNPPNPIDAKTFLFTIVNKTDMPVKATFFYGDRKTYKGVVIAAGKPYTFEIEGRYNKKDSYFRFRKPGKDFKRTGFKFYYKIAAKKRNVKIDQIYLLTDEEGLFIVSAGEEINPATTILKAEIDQKLEAEKGKKHWKPRRAKRRSKRREENNIEVEAVEQD